MSRPLPTRSSTQRHKNCIIRMKVHIKNVAIKSNKKLLMINQSSFFICRLGNFIAFNALVVFFYFVGIMFICMSILCHTFAKLAQKHEIYLYTVLILLKIFCIVVENYVFYIPVLRRNCSICESHRFFISSISSFSAKSVTSNMCCITNSLYVMRISK